MNFTKSSKFDSFYFWWKIILATVILLILSWSLASTFAETHIVLKKGFWTCTEWDGTRTILPTEHTCSQYERKF